MKTPPENLKTWLPLFYETINNINMIFSNYFKKRHILHFETLNDILVSKAKIIIL